jgi:hypothetical protein
MGEVGDKTGGDKPREHCILKWDAVGSILKQTKTCNYKLCKRKENPKLT